MCKPIYLEILKLVFNTTFQLVKEWNAKKTDSHSQKAAANRLTEGQNYLVNKTSSTVYNFKPSKRMDIKHYVITYFKVFRHIFDD